MPLAVAAIAPHGAIAIPELLAPHEADLARATRDGFARLARAAAGAERVVLLTPHGLHVEGAMSVVVAATRTTPPGRTATHTESAEFDARVVDIVRRNALGELRGADLLRHALRGVHAARRPGVAPHEHRDRPASSAETAAWRPRSSGPHHARC